jgi:predicted  nucleic acid-binding Zn ribbon protein
MHKVTMTFDFKHTADNAAVHKVWALVAAYLGSGQLVGDQWVTRTMGGKSLCVTGVAHERSAFLPQYQSKDARKALAELKPLIRKRVRIEWERFAEDALTCDCRKPGRLLFSPDVVLGASPFRCLDCRGRRPMYRLGRGADSWSVRGLARQWDGFYWTWMDSGQTEALAWQQLADPSSELGRMVRKRLRELEKKVRIPVYYDLLAYYVSKSGDCPETTQCPGCGSTWEMEKGSGMTCARCRLFSYLPFDGQPPDWWRPLPRHRRAGRRSP